MRARAGIVLVIGMFLVLGLAGPVAAAPTTLRLGASGPEVAELQRRLLDAGYWLGEPDGQFGVLTQQAVIAFQKVHGLGRDGVYGPLTTQALTAGPADPSPRSTAGTVVEIDKGRQVLMLVRDGRAESIFNTSTGNGQTYLNTQGDSRIAATPSGQFTITRQIDGLRISDLGELWRPKYFNGGIAVHGSTSVPAYPASHGCVRLTNTAMNWIWNTGLMPIGTPVWVY